MLHTVNKSPFERNSLDACLGLAKPGSTILLIEDGVVGAIKGTAIESKLSETMQASKIYVLGPDLAARGLSENKLLDGIQVVDYGGFVDLVTENDSVQSWL